MAEKFRFDMTEREAFESLFEKLPIFQPGMWEAFQAACAYQREKDYKLGIAMAKDMWGDAGEGCLEYAEAIRNGKTV
jgi:hypothetical protein